MAATAGAESITRAADAATTLASQFSFDNSPTPPFGGKTKAGLFKQIYFTTNEINHLAAVERLKHQPLRGNTLVTLSGLQSIRFLMARPETVHTMINIDPNVGIAHFWHLICQVLIKYDHPDEATKELLSETRKQFTECGYLDLLEDLILNENSALSSPHAFARMKSLAECGRIIHVCVNINDEERVADLASTMRDLDLFADTIYISNAFQGFWAGYYPSLSFIHTLCRSKIGSSFSEQTTVLACDSVARKTEHYFPARVLCSTCDTKCLTLPSTLDTDPIEQAQFIFQHIGVYISTIYVRDGQLLGDERSFSFYTKRFLKVVTGKISNEYLREISEFFSTLHECLPKGLKVFRFTHFQASVSKRQKLLGFTVQKKKAPIDLPLYFQFEIQALEITRAMRIFAKGDKK